MLAFALILFTFNFLRGSELIASSVLILGILMFYKVFFFMIKDFYADCLPMIGSGALGTMTCQWRRDYVVRDMELHRTRITLLTSLFHNGVLLAMARHSLASVQEKNPDVKVV